MDLSEILTKPITRPEGTRQGENVTEQNVDPAFSEAVDQETAAQTGSQEDPPRRSAAEGEDETAPQQPKQTNAEEEQPLTGDPTTLTGEPSTREVLATHTSSNKPSAATTDPSASPTAVSDSLLKLSQHRAAQSDGVLSQPDGVPLENPSSRTSSLASTDGLSRSLDALATTQQGTATSGANRTTTPALALPASSNEASQDLDTQVLENSPTTITGITPRDISAEVAHPATPQAPAPDVRAISRRATSTTIDDSISVVSVRVKEAVQRPSTAATVAIPNVQTDPATQQTLTTESRQVASRTGLLATTPEDANTKTAEPDGDVVQKTEPVKTEPPATVQPPVGQPVVRATSSGLETAFTTSSGTQQSAQVMLQTTTLSPGLAFEQAPSLVEKGVVPQLTAAATTRSNGGVVEVLLDPPELGRVEIQMELSDQGLKATLSAERQATVDLLRRHLEVLAQQFEEAGFADVDLDFAAFSDGEGSNENEGGSAESAEDAGAELVETSGRAHLSRSTIGDNSVDIRL